LLSTISSREIYKIVNKGLGSLFINFYPANFKKKLFLQGASKYYNGYNQPVTQDYKKDV